ncbi:C4BPA protein, partial [Chaetorhynchus papuensis]|nr:C4BPA protein [Chaetorhynchus papuensis]
NGAGGSGCAAPAVIALLPAGDCPPPPRMVFAEPITAPQQSYPEGAVVRYRCRPGYARKGNESPDVTCLADSTWSRKPPFCTRKSCGPLHIKNGDFRTTTDLLFGATVTFTCDAGYRLVGPPSAECVVRNGEVVWTALPSCEIVLCPPLPEIQNGKLLDQNEEFTFGMAASYSCNPGLSLVGEATIFCTIGSGFQGVWSSPPPECKEVKCENPQVKNGKKLSGFGTEYTYGNKVSFECNPGYSMKGSSVVTCDANSAWTPPVPTCEEILCGRPPELPSASLTTAVGDSSAPGATVTYRCNPGYRREPGSSSVLTCQNNETWSAANPLICVRESIGCRAPEVPNGKVYNLQSTYRAGDTLHFSCDASYTTEDAYEARCQPGGTWDPPVLVCQRVRPCPTPPEVANGNHNEQGKAVFTAGMSVRYSCNPGYYLVGNPTVSCRASGNWSQPRPRCEGESGLCPLLRGQTLIVA